MDCRVLFELNKAFAVWVVYCRDKGGTRKENLNVSGGAIAMSHPYGISGAPMMMHAFIGGE